MRILFEIGHPAHVHFFAPAIGLLQSRGHEIHVATRNKEITNALLDKTGIPYICLSEPKKGALGLATELLYRWFTIAKIIKQKQIQLVVSISGISTSLPSKLLGVRNLNFTDTEDAKLSNLIAFPFSDKILTPSFFLRPLGDKQTKYDGLHELAYLQKFDFDKAKATRKKLGLPERYSIIRAVSNDALHDRGLRSISEKQLQKLIEVLKTQGQVFITSQDKLPESLKAWELVTPIEHIHAVLSGAQAFVGDSPTMAVESAILGTPAFLVSQRVGHLGNMCHLESDFGLLKNFTDWAALEAYFDNGLSKEDTKSNWQKRAEQFRKKMPDMTQTLCDSIEEELACAA